MQVNGQGDDIPIMCPFHALHAKITYELCVTALFVFHVPHKRSEFENGLYVFMLVCACECLCGGRGQLFCDPVSVMDCIALDGRMINEFEGIWMEAVVA
jgi:hypothetical protein